MNKWEELLLRFWGYDKQLARELAAIEAQRAALKNPSQETLQALLDELILNLGSMLQMMELDPHCNWLTWVRSSLRLAEEIKNKPFDLDDVKYLAGSLCSPAGPGSFDEYWPGKYDSKTGSILPIPGMEDFEMVRWNIGTLVRYIFLKLG